MSKTSIQGGALGELKPKIKEAAKKHKELKSVSERIAQIQSSSSEEESE